MLGHERLPIGNGFENQTGKGGRGRKVYCTKLTQKRNEGHGANETRDSMEGQEERVFRVAVELGEYLVSTGLPVMADGCAALPCCHHPPPVAVRRAKTHGRKPALNIVHTTAIRPVVHNEHGRAGC